MNFRLLLLSLSMWASDAAKWVKRQWAAVGPFVIVLIVIYLLFPEVFFGLLDRVTSAADRILGIEK